VMSAHLNYQLIRSKRRRKTISLHVREDGGVVVYAPYRTPEWEIERFLKEKERWISVKRSEMEKARKPAPKLFLPGEEFLYLGESYPLEVQDQPFREAPLKLSFGRFILSRNRVERAKDLFVAWYKKEARDRLAERVDYYSHKFQLFPRGIRITSARSRWGSCSRDNQLCFSWRIVMVPLSVLDYVLIHELVHIREKNHSRSFWGYLESLVPDYRKQRRWLRDHEHLLSL